MTTEPQESWKTFLAVFVCACLGLIAAIAVIREDRYNDSGIQDWGVVTGKHDMVPERTEYYLDADIENGLRGHAIVPVSGDAYARARAGDKVYFTYYPDGAVDFAGLEGR